VDVVVRGLLPEQRAFVGDQAPRVAALCSRRAGKSHALAAWYLLGGLLEPGGLSLYVTRTASLAREVLWDGALASLGRGVCELELRQGQYYAALRNGHRIWLGGCSDRTEVDRYRGPRYRRAAVDEAQSLPWLAELLEEAVEPALLDHRGQLRLTGTPGPIPAGPYYDATSGGGGWSVHHWTMRQNTHLGDVEDWLQRLRSERGWTDRTPRYRREYLGEWVLDAESLVYPYHPSRNQWLDDLPPGTVRTALGVDLGSTGTSAIVVVSTVVGLPDVYVRSAETRTGLSVSQLAVWVQSQAREWSATRVVVDAGGLGGAYVDELRSRYGVQAEAAEKTAKSAAIAGLSGDLTSGVLRVDPRRCRPLIEEWAGLVWDDVASARAGRPVYSDRLPDHASDACLYAWRAVRPLYRPEREPPREGSPEWEREQVRLAVAKQQAGRRR
jgi:hypothetical protein